MFVGLVLCGLEGAFSLAGIGEQEYLQPNTYFGFGGIPGKQVTWRTEGFSHVTFNSFGMQDNERIQAKPAGTSRIAVLGDSFVEALQVDRKRNFCSVLESQLKGSGAASRWEVLNFGASAFDIGQMYLRLKHQVKSFGPDVVIVAVRPDTVFSLVPDPTSRNMLSARPAFYLQNGKLEMTNALQDQWSRSTEGKRFRLTSWLRAHSHIYGVVSVLMRDLQLQLPAALPKFNSAAPAAETALLPPPPAAADNKADTNKDKATRYYWPLEEAILLATKQECQAMGSKLVILRLPASGLSRNDTETALLSAMAAKHGIPYLETDSTFASQPPAPKLFYDNHLSPAGHKLLAGKLDAFLRGL